MMLLTKVIMTSSSIKHAVNTYMQIPQVSVNVLRIGPYIKKEEKTGIVTMITLYDLSKVNTNDVQTVKDELHTRTLKAMERAHILETLEDCDWNITRAAGVLGINRVTLHKKIDRFELRALKK